MGRGREGRDGVQESRTFLQVGVGVGKGVRDLPAWGGGCQWAEGRRGLVRVSEVNASRSKGNGWVTTLSSLGLILSCHLPPFCPRPSSSSTW